MPFAFPVQRQLAVDAPPGGPAASQRPVAVDAFIQTQHVEGAHSLPSVHDRAVTHT